ncbi:MAG TPA: TIM barrel protein [Verrucomicrobiota bacterium]|nr:TIM barrel protein [Verrucomicrobiota bacterium]HQL77091.1 TIM barrel protein [Verrucomicrobiota bacterium]
MHRNLSRRSALRKMTEGTAALTAIASLSPGQIAAEEARPPALKGNIRHSVSAWCYGSLFNPGKDKPAPMSFEDFCRACYRLGLESVELLGEAQWPAVKKAGLTCAMCNGPDSIPYGWNRLEHHDDLLAKFEKSIPKVAEAGFLNIITFSGNRNRMSDEQGLENCVTGLKRLMPIAEKHKVTVCVELLNSKRSHKDYMADHTAWGVELCRRVGSERLKLLYDIFHMQIMEGDVIDTIRENHQYIAHYHTGGVPGRNEIDDTQEINYPSVMRAIVATGYKGFVGQEFVPRRPDPLASLKQSVQICDV